MDIPKTEKEFDDLIYGMPVLGESFSKRGTDYTIEAILHHLQIIYSIEKQRFIEIAELKTKIDRLDGELKGENSKK